MTALATARAYTFDRYGGPDVLRLEEVAMPAARDKRVLVEVRAAALNPLDWHRLRGLPYVLRLAEGLRRPRRGRLGGDVAGVVVGVGEGVTRFQPGDRVFGFATGALATHVGVAEKGLASMPEGIDFAQAAAIPVAGATALQGLRDHGNLQPDQSVLVNGASGGVGTFAVQLARVLGAEVTGVCSGRNGALVRSLGATKVVDYTRTDFTRLDQRFDLVLDAVGNRSLRNLRRILTPDGALVIVGARDGNWIAPFMGIVGLRLVSPFVRHRIRGFFAQANPKDLTHLGELVAQGKVRSVIDRTYLIAEVPRAITHLETRRARGKLVVTM